MIVLFVTGIIALFLIYKGSKGELPFGLELAFFLVAFIASIHYNYGNDYVTYYNYFYKWMQMDFSWDDLVNKKYHEDFGWPFLCFIFKPVGFLWMIVFLSFFQNAVYYTLVKKFVVHKWQLFAAFIYLFNENIYVLNMSMMRQGLAVTLCVLAWMLVYGKQKYKIMIAMCIWFVATTMHNSAIIFAPFLFWRFIPMKNIKYLAVVIGLVFFILLFNNNILISIYNLAQDQETMLWYATRHKNVEESSIGLGFILLMIPFVLSLIYLFHENGRNEDKCNIVSLSAFGFLIIPFALMNPMVRRLTFYFLPFSIVALPIVYDWLKEVPRRCFLFLYIFVTMTSYFKFFYDRVWYDFFFHFHSVFDVIF